METRKTGSTNNRQDLLAEMLGVMARLRAAEEPSPADVFSQVVLSRMCIGN